MKKYFYPLAFAASLLSFTACSDDVEPIGGNNNPTPEVIPDSQKEMISFSVSDQTPQTRAGFVGANTYMVMRIKSDRRGGTETKYTRTEAMAEIDANNNATSYSKVSFNTSSTSTSNESDNKRYWDDAHGRYSLLSVYAVAVPNASNTLTNNSKTLLQLISEGNSTDVKGWGDVSTNTISWKVSNAQTLDISTATNPTGTIANEDLVFSNNISSSGTNGIYRWDYSTGTWKYSDNGNTNHDAGQMLFYQSGVALTASPTEAAGHFDRGHLVFNHALTRMTITLVAGEGFTSKPFKFNGTSQITLKNMPTQGTLDLTDGTWGATPTKSDITQLAKTSSETNAVGTYVAQMLPGYSFINSDNTNVMEFTIDDNAYYITQDMLFDALTYDANGNGTKDAGDGDLVGATSPIIMAKGNNYRFNITVNKTGISALTATLVDWSNVTAADVTKNNAHITVTTNLYESSGTNDCNSFVLYRLGQDLGSIQTGTYTATNYQGDYKTGGSVTPTDDGTQGSNKKWKTTWFFEDNKTAYHIRSVNTTANGTIANPATDPKHSFFEMENGAQSTHDYHWGAPMNTTSTDKYKYDETNGYESHLHQGITATESVINITELHMMSNINIVLKTTSDASAVDLRTGSGTYTYATVELTQLYSKANVDMGIGLVTPTGSITATEIMTAPTSDYFESGTTQTKPFTWAVVPQFLSRTGSDTGKIGVTITTPDGNKYYAELDGIAATSHGTSQNQGNTAINRWFPGHSYTYTFTIKKTGIESITCSLADWIPVTAGNTDLNLEH